MEAELPDQRLTQKTVAKRDLFEMHVSGEFLTDRSIFSFFKLRCYIVFLDIFHATHIRLQCLDPADKTNQLVDRRCKGTEQLIKGHQHTGGECPVDHQCAARHQNKDADRRRDSLRHSGEDFLYLAQPLFRPRVAGIMPQNAGHILIFRTGRLQGAGDGKTRVKSSHHLSGILLCLHGERSNLFGNDVADKKVDTHARHADGGQKRTVNKHQYQIEAGYKRIQNRLSQLARQKIRHVIIVLHPLGEVSGIALVKKRNRQPEHAVEKFMSRYQCHFGLESDQHQSAVPGKQTLEKDCSCHSDQQCAQPVGATAQQDIVDKYLGVDRSHKPRHHQQQPGSDESRHSDALSFEPLPDKARKRSNTFLLAEILTRFKNQHDPGERVIQILQSQLAASYGRVVDVRTATLKALKNHKMVKIPVDDGRRPDPAQVLDAFAVALADHAELPGGPKDVAGVAAVP